MTFDAADETRRAGKESVFAYGPGHATIKDNRNHVAPDVRSDEDFARTSEDRLARLYR